jgi:hypothetical protein
MQSLDTAISTFTHVIFVRGLYDEFVFLKGPSFEHEMMALFYVCFYPINNGGYCLGKVREWL